MRAKLYRCDPSRRMRGYFPIDNRVGIADLGLEIEDCFSKAYDDTTQVEVWVEHDEPEKYHEGTFRLFWIMEKKKSGGVRITTEDLSLEQALTALKVEREFLTGGGQGSVTKDKVAETAETGNPAEPQVH